MRRRNLEIFNLFIWVIGIPLIGFILAIMAWISVKYVSSSPLLPLVYLLVLLFLGLGILWNQMHGNSEFKALKRYLKHNETQEDIKTAKDLKYVTLIFILFLIALIQSIYEIIR